MSDPMEQIIAEALDAAGVSYSTDEGGGNPSGLDFRLHNGIEIEVKQFHSDRIGAQMARADNVIAVQGRAAVEYFASLIKEGDQTAKVRRVRAAICKFINPYETHPDEVDEIAKAAIEAMKEPTR